MVTITIIPIVVYVLIALKNIDKNTLSKPRYIWLTDYFHLGLWKKMVTVFINNTNFLVALYDQNSNLHTGLKILFKDQDFRKMFHLKNNYSLNLNYFRFI